MKPRKKIAVIIPWFGSWPGWIEYFLLSCRWNPAIDWIFPSDAPDPCPGAENLKFIPCTLQEFSRKAGERLDLDLDLRFPYKICDFKPAYGHIFSDLIRDYKFWGYGDLDLVYGAFGDFIPDSLLETHDVISNHPDFITGHLCLLRNTKKIRELYATGEAYRKAFTSKYYTGFDERSKPFRINPDPDHLYRQQKADRNIHQFRYRTLTKIKKLLPGHIPRIQQKHKPGRAFKDFSSIVKTAEKNGLLKVAYGNTFESDLMLAKQGIRDWEVTWQDGSLRNRDGNEILYFHFMRSKARETFKIAPFKEGLEKFHISSTGISG